MGVEIERKFLVNRAVWNKTSKHNGTHYRQGYILSDPDKTVRVRLAGDEAHLTIKGPSVGASRPEFEYKIPASDASELLNQFCTSEISKIRFKVYHEGKLWEVDEFLGENAGLMVAELELADEHETFSLPDWIEREITDDVRYYNARLSVNPYKNWKEGV
ncbi:MAG: CYTH domain-containing protein [Chitinophagaceae bacterium]